MITAAQTDLLSCINDLQNKTEEQLALYEDSKTGPAQQLNRLTFDCPAQTLLNILKKNTFNEAVYWESRNGDESILGLGVADQKKQGTENNVTSLVADIQDVVPEESDARYYGGISFYNHSYTSSPWKSFGVHHFILPRFEFKQSSRGSQVSIQFLIHKVSEIALLKKEIELAFQQLRTSLEGAELITPKLSFTTHTPSNTEWKLRIETVKEEMSAGEYSKIVCARKSSFSVNLETSAADICNYLAPHANGAYRFVFQPQRDHAFISISPELLYRRNQSHLITEAIAGTRASQGDSDKVSEELSASKKDQDEQKVVLDMITETLRPLSQSIQLKGQEVLKLSYVQHLKDRIDSILNPLVDDGQLIKALHPTPAVGGYPRAITREKLKESEPFERGWYAGLFGWLGADETELAVGIRSARLIQTTLDVFTGAGIVVNSNADAEWQELNDKMHPFTQNQCKKV